MDFGYCFHCFHPIKLFHIRFRCVCRSMVYNALRSPRVQWSVRVCVCVSICAFQFIKCAFFHPFSAFTQSVKPKPISLCLFLISHIELNRINKRKRNEYIRTVFFSPRRIHLPLSCSLSHSLHNNLQMTYYYSLYSSTLLNWVARIVTGELKCRFFSHSIHHHSH